MEDPVFEKDHIRFSDGLEVMFLVEGSDKYRERDDVYYMLKSIPYLESYEKIRDELAQHSRINNIFEIGVFRGGSTVYLHRYFGPKKLSCIDQLPQVIPLDRYVTQVEPDIKVHYNTDQGDKAALRSIIESDFDAPIDLIVDDASHIGELSRATFEASFPYLRRGGIYVVEDWSWSHDGAAQTPDHYWWKQNSCTNLIYELLAIYANGASGLISSINFAPGLMWVKKGSGKTPEDFRVADFTNLRGRTLPVL